MKVLLINGSPRAKGNTFIALSEVAKTLQEAGVETQIIHIGTQPVRGCVACGACRKTIPIVLFPTPCMMSSVKSWTRVFMVWW